MLFNECRKVSSLSVTNFYLNTILLTHREPVHHTTVMSSDQILDWTGLDKKRFRDVLGCEADLSRRGDGASGDAHGVDASIGVLVDFDVGSLFPGLDVSR